MLLRPAASTSPSAYRRLAQQQLTGLGIRFLGLLLLAWAMRLQFMPFAEWHGANLHTWLINPFTQVTTLYCVISLSLFLSQMIWVNKRWLFIASSMSDALLTICLLVIYPNKAIIGFAISLTAMLAMFQGLSARFILILSLILAIISLIVAHIFDILVISAPLPMHGVQILLILFALMSAWRFESNADQQQNSLESEIHPISGLPRLKALHTSLHYLLPYHQRNKIPMSLVMVHTNNYNNDQNVMRELATSMLSRIRHSDVLVHLDDVDFVVLLCDTSVSGASVLARDLALCLMGDSQVKLTFAVSSVSLDNTAIDPLLIRMKDALKQAIHQQTNRIIFVTEEKPENLNLEI
jgi:GGDEF domain-containing protein